MKIRIRYADLSPDAKANFKLAVNNYDKYSKIGNLKIDGVEYESFDNPCELYSVLLDSKNEAYPNFPTSKNMPLISNALSELDGSFISPIVLTLTATGQYTSQGITLTFDTFKNIYVTDLTIDWYRNNSIISSKVFTPDSATYFCKNKVQNYDKLIITMRKINMPQNKLRLFILDHGVIRNFLSENNEIESCSIEQEVNQISMELSINTADFTLNTKDDIEFVFQNKQSMKFYYNDELKAVGFVQDSQRLTKNKHKISTVDYIGLLDKTLFYGGIYTNRDVRLLIKDIINGVSLETNYIPYSISTDIIGNISGYLPIMTCREALAQVLFVTGAVADTSNSSKINIFKIKPTATIKIPLENIYSPQSFERNELVSQVQLSSYSYSQLNETTESYKAENSGIGNNIFVTFNEPLHSLAITNGTILRSESNYAIINATNADCILTGKKYKETIRIYNVVNPIWTTGQPITVAKVDNVKINQDPQRTAQRVFDYMVKPQTVNANVKVNGFKVGDTVNISSEYLGDITGVCQSMRYKLIGNFIKAEVTVR